MQLMLDEEDLKGSRIVAYFGARWMPANKRTLRNFELLSKNYQDIKFLYVDADNFKELCKRNSIESIPHYLLINSEKGIREGINGMVLSAALKSRISEIFKGK